MNEILLNPVFLIPAGFGASIFFGFIILPKLMKNGNVKQNECSDHRMKLEQRLGAIGKSISNIEGYLEGIYGKKIKK